MLRSALLVVGIILTGIGFALLIKHGTFSGWPYLIWGPILLITVLFERWRYRRIEHSKSDQWQRTEECFEDPETGQNVEVLYNPSTGERRYVPKDTMGRTGHGEDGSGLKE
jgi:hypothetical protein